MFILLASNEKKEKKFSLEWLDKPKPPRYIVSICRNTISINNFYETENRQ